MAQFPVEFSQLKEILSYTVRFPSGIPQAHTGEMGFPYKMRKEMLRSRTSPLGTLTTTTDQVVLLLSLKQILNRPYTANPIVE